MLTNLSPAGDFLCLGWEDREGVPALAENRANVEVAPRPGPCRQEAFPGFCTVLDEIQFLRGEKRGGIMKGLL